MAYMPYKYHVHRFNNDLVQPRLVGFRRTVVLAGVVAHGRHRRRRHRRLRSPGHETPPLASPRCPAWLRATWLERPHVTMARRCTWPSRRPRPVSIRRRPTPTSTRRSSSSQILEAPLGYDYLARPVRLQPVTADGAARGLGRRSHLHSAHQARHLLRRRPGLQRSAARARRRTTMSTRSSASTTRSTTRATCTCSSRSSCWA